MADVSQNIGAQLFVKELPGAYRADFTGCKQDFSSDAFTTCVNYPESDADIENAFQKQLNLSEYYKSPQVFESLKQNYMMKTMDSHFETAPVDLNPDVGENEVSEAKPDLSSMVQQDIKDSGLFTKSSFGAMGNSNIIVLIIVVAILFYLFQ